MSLKLSCFVLAVIVALVHGHAILRTPSSWNTNPSKSSPCGGGVKPAAPTDFLKPGDTVQIVWEVVAADGAGVVSASIDTTGNTNFVTGINLPLTGPTPTTRGVFTFTATIPADLTCTGPQSTCSMQVRSDSNWFSCALFTQTNTTRPVPKDLGKCTFASQLTFCTMLNQQAALKPSIYASLADMDKEAKETYDNYLANPNVFHTPDQYGCKQAYKKFLCGMTFKDCTSTPENIIGGCKQACEAVNTLCGITEQHQFLYPCGDYNSTTVKDVTGICGLNYSAAGIHFNAYAVAMTIALALVFAAAVMFF